MTSFDSAPTTSGRSRDGGDGENRAPNAALLPGGAEAGAPVSPNGEFGQQRAQKRTLARRAQVTKRHEEDAAKAEAALAQEQREAAAAARTKEAKAAAKS